MTLYDRIKALGSSTVSDVLDEAGYHSQTIDPDLLSLGSAEPFCGPACCVRGERRVATRTPAKDGCYIPMYALPTLVHEGAVLVFAVGGFRGGAVLGGLIAHDLQETEAAAVITDGRIRDRTEIAKGSLPVIAAGGIPINGARRIQITGSALPVAMPAPEGGTVLIYPGDIILGDADGAVVIPAAIAEDVLQMGEEIARKEADLVANLHTMTMDERAIGRANRMSHVRWIRESEA
jgi:regulator of RNase E activity RraA